MFQHIAGRKKLDTLLQSMFEDEIEAELPILTDEHAAETYSSSAVRRKSRKRRLTVDNGIMLDEVWDDRARLVIDFFIMFVQLVIYWKAHTLSF